MAPPSKGGHHQRAAAAVTGQFRPRQQQRWCIHWGGEGRRMRHRLLGVQDFGGAWGGGGGLGEN
ncbi:UNVERIFIED_CONTAM: hypothetical protein Sradi_6606100 [Sesamum radiatum]|uniref:Uncharacterized protein n=1 Tax=Sesamum radiatum TaxID=300843 RepID=A0AAW2JZA2_SESRA